MVRAAVGTQVHAVYILSPMMHLPASATLTVSYYVSISLDYLLIVKCQLVSLSVTVTAHCLTFGLVGSNPSTPCNRRNNEGNHAKEWNGEFENRENMEVFKILSVLDSNQQILSEVEYLHFGLLKDVAVIHWHFGSSLKNEKKKSISFPFDAWQKTNAVYQTHFYLSPFIHIGLVTQHRHLQSAMSS